MKKNFCILLFFLFNCFTIAAEIYLNDADTAISLGLANSKLLNEKQKSSLLQMKKSKYSILPFLPRFSCGWNEHNQIIKQQPDTRHKSIEFSVSQLLFDNGKTYLTYSINTYISFLSYLETQKEIREYALSILETYYNLILKNMMIKIKSEFLENTRNELEIIEYKYNSGLALKTDLLEFQISCKELSNELIKLNQEKQTLYSDLKFLLNLNEETKIILPESVNEFYFPTDPLTPMLSQYKRKITEASLEIKQAEADFEYQKKQYKISRQNFLPDISLEGIISFSGSDYPLTQPDYSLKLVFSFSNLPFLPFQHNSLSELSNNKKYSFTNSTSATLSPDATYFTQRKIQQSNLNQSRISLEKLINQTKNTITELINTHDNLIEYISLLKETQKIKEEKIKISEYEFENGLIKTNDYLKEKNEYSEYRQKLISSQIELISLQKKIQILIN